MKTTPFEQSKYENSLNKVNNLVKFSRKLLRHQTKPEASRAFVIFLRMNWIPANFVLKNAHTNDNNYCFFRGVIDPFIIESEENLRTTMLFKWLQGEFGPVDDPKISNEDIRKIWEKLMENSVEYRFYYSTKFYVDKEIAFWNRMFPQLKNEIIYSTSWNTVTYGYGDDETSSKKRIKYSCK